MAAPVVAVSLLAVPRFIGLETVRLEAAAADAPAAATAHAAVGPPSTKVLNGQNLPRSIRHLLPSHRR